MTVTPTIEEAPVLRGSEVTAFGRIVRILLDSASPAERDAMADAALWFLSTTTGALLVGEPNTVFRGRGDHRLDETEVAACARLTSDAALIYEDGISTGDLEQAADALRLAAGLAVLAGLLAG